MKRAMPIALLVLAFSSDQPDGDVADRLILRVPLDATGRIVDSEYRSGEQLWRFDRELPDGSSTTGDLAPAEEGWMLRTMYSNEAASLAGTIIRPGEYLTLKIPPAPERVYRVVSVSQD
ncbi:MAG TPA: hypothetical protein VHS58_15385 [Acetobacteraceae bacterium]|nr:hypothetical protein [Acetobacteraceae bacterium]